MSSTQRKFLSSLASFSLLLFGLVPLSLQAAEDQPHIDHLIKHWEDTPQKQGLLTVLLGEAEIARTHADYAAGDLQNLDGMQLHAGHVLHALDPSALPKGPGMGYGLIKSAEGVALHAQLATEAESATDVIRVSGIMISSIGRNTAVRAQKAKELAQLVIEAGDAETTAPYAVELQALTSAIISGEDLNLDGKIVWYHKEGGLAVASAQIEVITAEQNQ
ncbi:hypothetical protein O4H49_13640 [Kiloniella laminariae]|uniref:Uncharacterized protein n=1 Tax=Kiloniella laminariae TaxID=454162 RepID=A0ABT4LL35_9PROT|nr:hypothetical protein [Kiloniella laminariae]MCZ4281828.1 hypothetical protein [Kiloniella laminariae]